MKLHKKIGIAVIAASVPLFSCSDLTVPESVTVKSEGAKYGFPLGSTEFKISEKFSAQKVQDAINSSSANLTVYEFNPENSGDSIIEYIMEYQVERKEIATTSFKTTIQSTLGALEGAPKTAVEAAKNAAIDAFIEAAVPQTNGKYVYTADRLSATIDTGLNFKSIFDSFASSDDEDGGSDSSERTDYSDIFNKIGFTGVKAYAYIDKDGIDSDIKFIGRIDVKGSDTEAATPYKLVNATLNPVSAVDETPDLASLADDNGVISTDFVSDTEHYPMSAELNGDNMTAFINGEEVGGLYVKHEKVIIDYELTPSIEFDNEDEVRAFLEAMLDENAESATATVSIILRFPLKLKIIEDIVIDDLLDFAGSAQEGDLLNRDDGEDGSDFDEYSDFIENINCEYKFTNGMNLDFSAKISSNTVDGEKFFEDKSIEFDGEEHSFSMDKSEISKIMSKSPFTPAISATISKTTSDEDDFIRITRDASFGAWAVFNLTTGGSAEVWNSEDSGE